MASATLHKPVATVDGFSLHYSGDVAIIVMDRGENRINKEFVNAFNELLDLVEKNESCKALITTGHGKFYSNGLDLKKFATMPQGEVSVVLLTFVKLLKRLLMFPVPTLAALNGHAFAGGALIAFAHDLRTMRTGKGWICLNEVFLNLQFGNFHLKLLEQKIGNGPNFNDALVMGKRYTAKDAFNVGMIHAMQPENLLLADSVNVLKSFYGQGYLRDSLVAMKTDVYKGTLETYEEEGIDEQIEESRGGILPQKSRL